jgi:L-ascorbate metabolism protein UlaG (beta-lactamase superfamily)
VARGEGGFPPHFDGKRYFNPNAAQARGFLDVLRWKLTSRPEPSPAFIADVVPSVPPASVDDDQLRVTLVNHSTVLLQQPGANILTDPIWSLRASPLTWAGPKRVRTPGVRWEDLPRIDVVLLSHNHYDHLDVVTLRKLAETGATQFVTPLGVGRVLRSHGIKTVHELDWGDTLITAGCTVHGVPALHFSARTPFDRNRTLWCGFILETSRGRVYFAGDTAFGEHFAQIRERHGAPRLALLPIGAYDPRWFMSAVHMSPEDAIRAHQILGAKTSVAIHHGTFKLTDEGIDTPKRRLRERGAGESFVVLANGESITIGR